MFEKKNVIRWISALPFEHSHMIHLFTEPAISFRRGHSTISYKIYVLNSLQCTFSKRPITFSLPLQPKRLSTVSLSKYV